MRVKFVGATKHITGSCSLLLHETTGTKFLVDCGMYQGGMHSDWENSQNFLFNPREIKFVLLTHAHLDHCGLIPRLYKEGFVGKVYCTRATAKLAKIVMEDSSNISNIYDIKDVEKVNFYHVDTNNKYRQGKSISLEDGLRATFIRSSHILGATGISINWLGNDSENNWKTIHFSGDIGSNFEERCYLPLLKHNHIPFPDTDYLVVESTYGGRVRDEYFKSPENRLNKLREVIEKTIFENNGQLIIPSFSIQRTQEIMVDLYSILTVDRVKNQIKSHIEKHAGCGCSNFSIYCDSNMARKANKVFSLELTEKLKNNKYKYKNNDLELDDSIIKKLFWDGFLKFNDNTCFIKVLDEGAKKTNPCENGNIIISSSGMCDEGPIKTYLDELGVDSKNTIVITGYQAKESKGSRILAKTEPKIKANVEDMSAYYSAHADETGLLEYIFNTNDTNGSSTSIFINHGTPDSKSNLEHSIKEYTSSNKNKIRVIKRVITLGDRNGWFNLNTGQEIMPEEGIDKNSDNYIELSRRIDYLTDLVELLVKNKDSN